MINCFSIDKTEEQGNTTIMTMSELLTPELVLPRVKCASKEELISGLMDCIYGSGRELLPDREEVLRAIQMRERIGGTLLPSGLAIPHARLGGFEGFIFALGTSMEPLFHDGIQIRLMALILSDQLGSSYYLPTVATLTKLSRDGEFISRLCEAENPETFLSILKEKDQELE